MLSALISPLEPVQLFPEIIEELFDALDEIRHDKQPEAADAQNGN
jgi:hypothetical protein